MTAVNVEPGVAVAGAQRETQPLLAEAESRGATAADFEQLCSDLYGRLVGALSAYRGDREVAEDMAQEALERAWADWSKVSRHDAPDAWVFHTAFNLTKSWYRRAQLARRRRSELPRDMSCEADVASAVTIRSAVDDLPSRQRQALVLRFFADLSVDAAAEVMACAPGTVRALTAQAVGSLRSALTTSRGEGDD